jgi:ATP-dependent DNA helicase MPH1
LVRPRHFPGSRIPLICADEAHKATGGYAYNQIVRWMMAKNPHFRLIALTATPGSNPEAVQNLVDGLHISHIEIRDENSFDLRPYLHDKVRATQRSLLPKIHFSPLGN